MNNPLDRAALKDFRERRRRGVILSDETFQESISLLTVKEREVLVPFAAALDQGQDPDLTHIGRTCNPPIHRTTVQRRLESAGKKLPRLWTALMDEEGS